MNLRPLYELDQFSKTFELFFLQSMQVTVDDNFLHVIPMHWKKIHEKHDTLFSVHESIHRWGPLFIRSKHSMSESLNQDLQ